MDSHTALIIVDLQLDFMPGGPLGVAGGDEICGPIAKFARAGAGATFVVATQDWHPAGHASFASSQGRAPFSTMERHRVSHTLWPDHCVQGTPGARLHPSLPDELVSLVLRKGMNPDVDSYSAFRENVGPDGERASTGLASLLRARGIEHVMICGLARDYCVRATAIDAAHAGFEVTLLDRLTRAVDPSVAGLAVTDAALSEVGVMIDPGGM